MQDSFLETLLVVDSMIKISAKSLSNFIAKLGSKAEICWKLKELKWNFWNNSEVSSYLMGHILLFWKVMMQTIEWIQNYQWITTLKKIFVQDRCVREVPRENDSSPTNFPPILTKWVFLYSVKTKPSEYVPLSWIQQNFPF